MAKAKAKKAKKTSAPKRAKVTKVVSAPKLSLPKVNLPKLPSIDRRKTLIGFGVVVVLVLLYFFKGLFVAAVVNGTPISRIALVQELEKQEGSSVLNALVTKELVNQEAKKSGVSVSKEEIDSEIKKIEESIESQGQTLDQALASQGWTRDDLGDQIRTQIIVEKLLADKVNVTDQEVDEYIKTNLAPTESKDDVKALLKQQKLMTEYQTWIANLLAQAKINYWVKY